MIGGKQETKVICKSVKKNVYLWKKTKLPLLARLRFHLIYGENWKIHFHVHYTFSK